MAISRATLRLDSGDFTRRAGGDFTRIIHCINRVFHRAALIRRLILSLDQGKHGFDMLARHRRAVVEPVPDEGQPRSQLKKYIARDGYGNAQTFPHVPLSDLHQVVAHGIGPLLNLSE